MVCSQILLFATMLTVAWLCTGGLTALFLFGAYKLLNSVRELKNSTVIIEGRTMPLIVTQEKVRKFRKTFPVRRGDLFVVSFPKSGTTWVQQIVRLVQLRGIVNDSDPKISDAMPWLEGIELPGFGSSNETLDDLQRRNSPRTFKTHLPYDMVPGLPLQTSPAKYIYVARNPKDTAVSLYTFSNKLFRLSTGFAPISWNALVSRFASGTLWYGDWCAHVLGWWAYRNEPNVLFLKYEDMQKDLPAVVRKVAEFLEEDLEDDIIESIASQCTFKNMRANSASNYNWAPQSWVDHFVKKYPMFISRLVLLGQGQDKSTSDSAQLMMRKGVVGDWRNHFTAQQSSEFDTAFSHRMKCAGLDFGEHIEDC